MDRCLEGRPRCLGAAHLSAVAGWAVAMIGRGSGSTPSGDDLLVGWLAGLPRQLRRGLPAHRALANRLIATCRLSRRFLHNALAGCFHLAFARLASPDVVPGAAHPLARALAEQGDRSGHASLAGCLAGLYQGA